MKKYITFAEFAALGNKYAATPVAVTIGYDSHGQLVNEIMPTWMTVFVPLYKLFSPYNVSVYKTDTMLVSNFTTATQFITEALISRYSRLTVAKEYQEHCSHVFTGPWIQPYYSFIDSVTEQEAYTILSSYIAQAIQYWCDANGPDILRTLSAIQLEYNPIENYNMIEHNFGEHKRTKDYDTKDINQITVSAPLADISVSKDTAGTYTFDTLTPTATKTLDEVVDGVVGVTGSDTLNRTTADTSETPVQTTTFDAEDYKNANKSTTTDTGSVNDTTTIGRTTTDDTTTTRDVTASVEFKLGNGEAGYTEKETYTNYGMDRSGNVGVTTTQQMLEQEIQLRNKQLIDSYISQCKSTWLSSVWM